MPFRKSEIFYYKILVKSKTKVSHTIHRSLLDYECSKIIKQTELRETKKNENKRIHFYKKCDKTLLPG